MNVLDLANSPQAKAHRRLHNVWLHDVADRLRLRRQAIANADGLDPGEVEKYPVSGDVTIVNQNTGPWMRNLLAGAALLAAGGTFGAVAAPWLAPPERTAAPQSAASTPATRPEALEFDVTFWAEDGTRIEIHQPTDKISTGLDERGQQSGRSRP